MTTPLHNLHLSLLRPSVLHILRASGFHAARPSVIDALVDVTSRYLILLASRTLTHASLAQNESPEPSISDVRMALQDVGALWPSTSAMEEQVRSMMGDGGAGETEDMRGIEAFLEWMVGPKNTDIRRIADMEAEQVGDAGGNNTTTVATAGSGPNNIAMAAEAEEKKADFLTLLKTKHSRTGEESRYQGTALGIFAGAREMKIEGGSYDSIQAWSNTFKGEEVEAQGHKNLVTGISTTASSPLTEIENV